MKQTILGCTALMLVASHAMAWDTPAAAQTQSQTMHQHQGQSQSATGIGVSRVTNSIGGSTVTVQNGGGNGGGGNGNTRAPDVVLPSIGGGGADCPVVGFGVGGSGLGGGGGFGPSWISPDCNARKLAEMLDRMGYPDAAVALLRDHFPEVGKAMQDVAQQATAAAPVVQQSTAYPWLPHAAVVATVPVGRDDWCQTARHGEHSAAACGK